MSASAYSVIGDAKLGYFFEYQRTNMRFFFVRWRLFFAKYYFFMQHTMPTLTAIFLLPMQFCTHVQHERNLLKDRTFLSSQMGRAKLDWAMPWRKNVCGNERFCQARWAEPSSIELCHGKKTSVGNEYNLSKRIDRAHLMRVVTSLLIWGGITYPWCRFTLPWAMSFRHFMAMETLAITNP